MDTAFRECSHRMFHRVKPCVEQCSAVHVQGLNGQILLSRHNEAFVWLICDTRIWRVAPIVVPSGALSWRITSCHEVHSYVKFKCYCLKSLGAWYFRIINFTQKVRKLWQNRHLITRLNSYFTGMKIPLINQHCPFTNLVPYISKIYIITRPGVARAVLQTPLQLIHSFSQSVSCWSFSSKSSKYH